MSREFPMNTTILRRLIVALATAGLLIACGGGGTKTPMRTGLGDAKPPPPPKQEDASSSSGEEVKRVISKDARKDYLDAAEYYKKQAAAGWSKGSCESAADKFASVASEHPKLIEARYMVGRSYHNCGMAENAEKEYQKALAANPSHALSLSNLGELYFNAGKVESAKKYWTSAIEADGKISAARNNLAWLMIKELRNTTDRKKWAEIEAEARIQLSNSLAVDSDNAKTYVLYGLLYLEGAERNRNRLDLAKLLLDEGAKKNENFAPLYNARGLLYMKRDRQSDALSNFEKAVALDPSFVEARMNVGNITLGFRKYEVAEEQFSKVLELQSDNYEATIGLGIAQRGLDKLDEAEASYKKAIKLDSKRGDAYFNLGVLYKDFRANRADGLEGSKAAYQEARDYFDKYISSADATAEGKKEAKDNREDCDKIIKQIEDAIKAMASAEGAAP